MDKVLKNALIAGREAEGPVDVAIRDGRIAAIDRDLDTTAEVLDLSGKLLAPGFVDSHIHLDKSGIRDQSRIVEGTPEEAFKEVVRQKKEAFGVEDVHRRAEATLRKCIAKGTTHMRTQLEVDPFVGLRGLEGVLPLVEAYKDAIDLEICVFPEEGLFNQPGTDALILEALKQGCSVIGANSYDEPDPFQQIDWVFDVARDHDIDIDMHLDPDESPDDMLVGYVCEMTEKYDYGGRVTLAHLNKLTVVPTETFDEIARRMAGAGVAATVLPITDLYLSGRDHEHTVPRGVLPVHRLLAHGVNCSLATNNVDNPLTPFAFCSANQLASLYAITCQVWRDDDFAECFEMVTRRAASIIGCEDYGVEVGKPADLVVLNNRDRVHAVLEPSPPMLSFKRGAVISENGVYSE